MLQCLMFDVWFLRTWYNWHMRITGICPAFKPNNTKTKQSFRLSSIFEQQTIAVQMYKMTLIIIIICGVRTECGANRRRNSANATSEINFEEIEHSETWWCCYRKVKELQLTTETELINSLVWFNRYRTNLTQLITKKLCLLISI